MKALALVLGILCFASLVAAQPTCLVVKHASTAHQFFVSGANWQYVAGDFPEGMKWKSNITDGTIRKVKKMGGKVAIIRSDYTSDDLAQTLKGCQ